MEKRLFLSEVLQEMKAMDDKKNPIPFSITVRTFNRQNKSGGMLKSYSNAVLLKPPKKKGVQRLAMNKPFKNPNHWDNRTRNIKLSTGEIKKINTLFIIEFNGKKVVY